MEGRTVFLKIDTSDLDNQIKALSTLRDEFTHTHQVFQEQLYNVRQDFELTLKKIVKETLTPIPTNSRVKSIITQVNQLEETRKNLIADIEALTKLKDKMDK